MVQKIQNGGFDNTEKRNEGCIVLVVFNHIQVMFDSFKLCGHTVTTDGSDYQLIHCLKPNQLCEEAGTKVGPDQLGPPVRVGPTQID